LRRNAKRGPKTTAPKPVDKIAFQLVDRPAAIRLTYVMKGGKKMSTVNAVAWFSILEEAEEFRRRFRLSGLNVSVVSKGASGFEVVVPKDELEKLTPEEKEAIKQYLEHVARTGDKEKKKAAEDVMSRFDFGTKAVNIGGVRLKLVHKKGKGVRAEKYGDPQLIAEIKTALERKLRETLGDEYEQWRDHIKTTEGRRRLVITQQLLEKLAQNPNTTKLNEKLKNTQKQRHASRTAIPKLQTRRAGVHGVWAGLKIPPAPPLFITRCVEPLRGLLRIIF
jgi:hypothetical protein